MTDILELVLHIINDPDTKFSEKHLIIGKHKAEYGDTKIRKKGKEHKLWTPTKDRKYRCFLIMQSINDIFTIHHILAHKSPNGFQNWLQEKGYSSLCLAPSKTYAAERGATDQFKGSIEIDLKDVVVEEGKELERASEIRNLLTEITDETVARQLNLSQR